MINGIDIDISPNQRKIFTEREKVLLVEIVNFHKDVIESKKTDQVNLRMKQNAWELVGQKYNANDVHQRDVKQLKKLWDNIKQKTRKADTARKYLALKTGGGPPPEEDNDPLLEKVRSVVPTINHEIKNKFDSIAVFENEVEVEEFDDVGETKPIDIKSRPIRKDHNYYSEILDDDHKTHEQVAKRSTLNSKSTIETKSRTIGIERNYNSEILDDNHNTSHVAKKSKPNSSSDFILEESLLRRKKLEESIIQQKELHKVKMEAANFEKLYWKRKAEGELM